MGKPWAAVHTVLPPWLVGGQGKEHFKANHFISLKLHLFSSKTELRMAASQGCGQEEDMGHACASPSPVPGARWSSGWAGFPRKPNESKSSLHSRLPTQGLLTPLRSCRDTTHSPITAHDTSVSLKEEKSGLL